MAVATLQELWSMTLSEWKRVKMGGFRLDVRKKLFAMRVVEHWNGLFRETVDAPSLKVFMANWDEALSNPMECVTAHGREVVTR